MEERLPHVLPIFERLIPISQTLWELPIGYRPGMRVPARIFATRSLIETMDAAVFDQIANVATLPGIQRFAYCMPDGHSGYGFPIGGVAAVDPEKGVISPGGIGFDINCGMRLVTTQLTFQEIRPHLRVLVDKLFGRVPTGVGSQGNLRIGEDDFRDLVVQGSEWCLKRGMATPEDLMRTEDGGRSHGADASAVSWHAVERGLRQVGTLGSGNHYLEIQLARAFDVYDEKLARKFGITEPDQVVIMFHCGSRGFGHQVATDYLRIFLNVMGPKYGIDVPDRELACAPFESREGQAYFSAMKCAINMSFANRQVILHRIREVFTEVLGKSEKELGLRQVYDIAHNTAKLEEHEIDGKRKQLLVHRKGSTRAFEGQPVIIGGSMETGSYLMTGVKDGAQSFFSSAHGAGRLISRNRARHEFHGRELADKMLRRGIYVRTASWAGLAEEAGRAYKDIDQVAEVSELAGLSHRVVKFSPIGNIKG